MSTSLAGQEPSFVNRVFVALAVLSVVGMVVLTVTAIAGFEEPNTTLLLTSVALVIAAPAAMLVHLIGTKELTGRQKRIWIRELASSRAARAFSAYLTADDRSAAAERLGAEASTRSNETRTQ
jgi:hypothetical protein